VFGKQNVEPAPEKEPEMQEKCYKKTVGGGGIVPGDRQGLLQPVQGDTHTRSEALDLPQELHQPEVRLGNVACAHPIPLLDIPFVR
jgi:hypothetical protein